MAAPVAGPGGSGAVRAATSGGGDAAPAAPKNPAAAATGLWLSGGYDGWIPGYSSSLRYYPAHGVAVAFQINTDIGIVDDSTPLMVDMETRLAEVVTAGLPAP